jgi:predicted SnoaL-like aldol condensation-catalyzing enzyme
MTVDTSSATAKGLVLKAIEDLFDRRDLDAIDRYWSPEYVDHSPESTGDRDGLSSVVRSLADGFSHERVRVLADGPMVIVHGIYHGVGAEPIAAFDLWRTQDGKIIEHWDARQPCAASSLSGHSMVDGAAKVTEPEQTAASRAVVQQFVDLIMMDGDRSQIGRFFDDDHFIQHNPLIADGVSGLGQAIQTGVWAAVVERAHRVLAEGEFVFTQAEGTLHGNPTIFYDLFRVQNGKLAEHWDVVFARPQQLRHDNGVL